MASQVFWLLSYVSLGLALTLGNRPTGIHSSQQQQQKQQSTSSSSSSSSASSSSSSSSSSSQTQKSRQDHRFSRDPTITDVVNELNQATAPEDQLDHLRSYRYEDSVELDDDETRNWLDRADKPWRDTSFISKRRDEQLEQEKRRDSMRSNGGDDGDGGGGIREASSSRENAFLDEFATAVLDTLYPRHRDLLAPPPAAKIPNIRQNYDTRRYNVEDNVPIIGYTEIQEQQPRNVKKLRISTQHEFPKKISRGPVVIYRTDDPVDTPLAKIFDIDKTEDERLVVQRSSSGSLDYPRNGGGWLNEPVEYSNSRNNEIKNRAGDYSYDSAVSIASSSSSTGNNIGNSKPPGKRNQGGGGRGRSSNPRGWSSAGQQSQTAVSNAGASIASQFLLRSARGNRQYDVPQIECPASEDGMERFACPTPDRMGRYRCIDDHVLCDGFIDCPAAEDEDRQDCMFYKTTKAHLDVLADALLRWARGR